MRFKRSLLILIVLLLILSAIPHPVEATRGLPNTASFGYGARLDMWGEGVFQAMELASSMGLDWVAVDVDWNKHWPSLNQAADFSSLDYVLQAARQKNIHVLLSLTNPPAWALTPSGPEPNYTNALLQSILNVYPDVIQAVELFPGVNKTIHWGATPNPQSYLTMLQTVRQGCDATGRLVYLVTTLEPTLTASSDAELDDRTFLESLYSLGGSPYMAIIGIRYLTVMGTPMSDQSELYPMVLRHYEEIRDLMLNHQHTNGMIWITSFHWPTSGTPNPGEPLALPATPAQQSQWVNQALQLMRAQLFIGAAFFSDLNPSTPAQTTPSLLLPTGGIHPASVTISQFSGGSLTSTSWSPPSSVLSTLPASAIPLPTTPPTYIHFEGKPRK